MYPLKLTRAETLICKSFKEAVKACFEYHDVRDQQSSSVISMIYFASRSFPQLPSMCGGSIKIERSGVQNGNTYSEYIILNLNPSGLKVYHGGWLIEKDFEDFGPSVFHSLELSITNLGPNIWQEESFYIFDMVCEYLETGAVVTAWSTVVEPGNTGYR